MDQLVRKVCIDMSTKVIRKTPVDTGRARANWFAAANSKPQGTTQSTDPSGGSTINEASSKAGGLKSGDTFYLINNLPYIEQLEDGYSQQAPAGMVKISVAEYVGTINKIAQGLK